MIDLPKTLRYGDALAAAEQRIVDALPEIVDGLIDRARSGNLKAALYLCDRIFGKAAKSATPPADDRQAPYTPEAFAEDRAEADSFGSIFAAFGARNGA